MPNNHFIYRLSFSTPLHIGNERDDYAQGSMKVHSDTLYAAIWFAYSQLGLQAYIPTDTNANDLGFVLSSSFPFYQRNETDFQYFLPRPLHTKNVKFENVEDTKLRKKVKKIAWVDLETFGLYINNQQPEYTEDKINGSFFSMRSIKEFKFVESQVMPRATVSRIPNEDTKIFYTERFYFPPNTGIYFIALFKDAEEQKRFEGALRLLEVEGIGTDRNVGNGKFTFSKAPAFAFPTVKTPNHLAMALGVYCPESKEELVESLKDENIGYELVERGGWLSEPYNTWRKKNVFMFNEGSIFKSDSLGILPKGKNVNVKPDEIDNVKVAHPVWRCGKTLFISF
jgi:CRISPR type III-A-associated RAMP protein Csm4